MKFIVNRGHLLKPLQQVNRLLSSRPTLPILGNILLQVTEHTISLTSTDLEIEIIAHIKNFILYETGKTTVSARKFLDICRNLPEKSEIAIELKESHMLLQSNRSKFALATLPAMQFPNLEHWTSEIELTLPQSTIKQLIESTQFAMAHQDVRYCLNGMLLETDNNKLRTVATDGHRLAICTMSIDASLKNYTIIVPRKGILQLMRILNHDNTALQLQIGRNNIRAHINNIIFTTKLIDGYFPNYRHVLPQNPDKILESDCDTLKQAFARAAIFSNEQFHGICLYIHNNQLKITASNQKGEKIDETIDVFYNGKEINICFNVNYLLDALNALKCKKIRIRLTNSDSSISIEDASSKQAANYVIMPIKL